ncbi:cupin domain-containing protein [Mucilaginibacter pedocola]|uniref:Cupin type-2 domain-containing protein n=1 Tax=Mucilaginibacter pedocola TaxID=1792845 RepID=A0A1S9PK21_9SPHI|nr:cupin domain-containing protein [Mucilaginibacter pedocola]OOQ61301.1 hypothetical protein BC343_20160 [Mucilaginibacter pedocola]
MKTNIWPGNSCEAENIALLGINNNIILSTERNGGKLTILEQVVNIGSASPLLTCAREEKVIYIAEGNFVLSADGQQYHAGKGASMLVPKGVVHHFKNIGTSIGKLLITLTPGRRDALLKGIDSSVKVYGENIEAIKNAAITCSV